MKTMLEILKLVRKELDCDCTIGGMCRAGFRLEEREVLTEKEVDLFCKYVRDNQTRISKIWQRFKGSLYHYPWGWKYPRKRFLDRHIKLLEKQ